MNEPQQRKLLLKTNQRIHRLQQVLFRLLEDVPLRYAEIEQPRHNGNTDGLSFSPIAPGERWGEEWQSALFVGEFSTPDAEGPVFFQADTGGVDLRVMSGFSNSPRAVL